MIVCKKHKKYKAIRPPTGECFDCWKKWFYHHFLKTNSDEIIKICEDINNEVVRNSIVQVLSRVLKNQQ